MKTATTRWLALAGFAFVAVTFVAWKKSDPIRSVNQYSTGYEEYTADTVPVRKKTYSARKDYKLNGIDEAMQEVDRAMIELDRSLKIDLGNMNKDLKAALEEVKNINFDKIHAEVRASLKEVDWDNVRDEIRRANKEVEKSLKEIDHESIHAEIDAAKASAFVNSDLIKNSIELGLKAAKLGIYKAKKELVKLKEFTEELRKDGLIKKDGAFTIEIKDHEMLIDGKKQSKEVNDKYRKYFKDGSYTLSSEGDDDDDNS
jgi:hypothetical protein